ncbi:Hypothetical predicted protein [Podarcis lilfordi]|uniref:Uncharacterized protein n=1 Tax=Podarcis lilfordi TaxID=74358 RepID=A0AA35KIF0_9SAUR|nr:Hypothetical predicted protein [Podarcis lilfordi]
MEEKTRQLLCRGTGEEKMVRCSTKEEREVSGQVEKTPRSAIFNDIIKGGPIPKTWTHSKIVSIPKPLKDSLKVESYRPISLINQDYKIFTSILANRLKSSYTS